MDFYAHYSSSSGNLYACSADAGGLVPSVLLIDPGVRMAEVRRALGWATTRAVGVLLSHHHGDHARAIPDLLRAGLDCWASRGTWAALGVQHHRAGVLEPQRAVDIPPWRVLPFDVRHDAEGALGFLIQAPDGDRLLFVVDTGFVPYRFAGLTHIAVECNYSEQALRSSDVPPEQKRRILQHHMSLERVLKMLSANDLSRVREITLLHLSGRHADSEKFRSSIERATGKPTVIAPERPNSAVTQD